MEHSIRSINTVSYTHLPILPLYIKHYMHMNDEFVATIVGIIIFGAGLFSALASISIGKITERLTMPRIVFTATWAVGTLFILQYIMPSIWGLGIFRAIAGFFMGFITPIANTPVSYTHLLLSRKWL